MMCLNQTGWIIRDLGRESIQMENVILGKAANYPPVCEYTSYLYESLMEPNTAYPENVIGDTHLEPLFILPHFTVAYICSRSDRFYLSFCRWKVRQKRLGNLRRRYLNACFLIFPKHICINFNKKFWEELIAYFPSMTTQIS
jgi:hypothetical protein